MKITFKIKHLMYLTLWTALILSVREPLIATAPELVTLIVWVSGIATAGIFIGLFGVALIMEGSSYTDWLFDRMCYALIAAGILFFLFSVARDQL